MGRFRAQCPLQPGLLAVTVVSFLAGVLLTSLVIAGRGTKQQSDGRMLPQMPRATKQGEAQTGALSVTTEVSNVGTETLVHAVPMGSPSSRPLVRAPGRCLQQGTERIDALKGAGSELVCGPPVQTTSGGIPLVLHYTSQKPRSLFENMWEQACVVGGCWVVVSCGGTLTHWFRCATTMMLRW
jgi:hypothetical protein